MTLDELVKEYNGFGSIDIAMNAREDFRAGWRARDEQVKELVEALELALSFAPKGPVPEGLDPTFYHTLNYQDELKLQERIDNARDALAKLKGST